MLSTSYFGTNSEEKSMISLFMSQLMQRGIERQHSMSSMMGNANKSDEMCQLWHKYWLIQ